VGHCGFQCPTFYIWNLSFFEFTFKFLPIQKRRQLDEDSCVPISDQVNLLCGEAKPPESQMRPQAEMAPFCASHFRRPG
jgi:hypothetical protein